MRRPGFGVCLSASRVSYLLSCLLLNLREATRTSFSRFHQVNKRPCNLTVSMCVLIQVGVRGDSRSQMQGPIWTADQASFTGCTGASTGPVDNKQNSFSFSGARSKLVPDHHRAQHGRQVDFHPAGRCERAHGPGGLLCSVRLC
jgi:hypothetical protein